MSDFVGATLGDYRLEAVIGAGRTGQVYRASHVRFESVRVAIRIFDTSLVDTRGFRTRFFEFAQAAGNLVHPNVVRIRQSGEDERRWFVAMDFMGGGTLEALRPAASTAEWLSSMWPQVDAIRQAAEGIAAGHAAGLAHGNVRLANLFTADLAGGVPQVKVGGLGLTTLVPNTAQPPSEAGDIFGLGEALYAITTGRDAFAAEVPAPGAALLDTATLVSPRRLVRGYPESLETIVVRCLATDNRDRFGSCAALADALREAVQASGSAGQSMVKVEHAGLPALLDATIVTAITKQAPQRPAPTIRPGAQAVPCVHVLDAAGNRVDMEYLQNTGLRLGRGPDNEIVLKSGAVSLEHARIDWIENRVTVTDLGSTNSTLMRGHRLLPQVPQDWDSEQWLQVGPYWLALEVPTSFVDIKDRIDVVIDQRGRSMTITPGKPTSCRVTLSNQCTTIQQVELSVEGIPSEWVQGTSTRRHLPPFEQRDMDLVVNIPRSPEGRAGTYTVTIRVHSFTDPTRDQGTAVATWTVEPFESSKLLLIPTKASGVRRASYNVALHNDGNSPLTYSLSGTDNDHRLECVFWAEGHPTASRLAIEVPPGEKANVRLQVQTSKRWFGSTTPHSFTVQATPVEGRQESRTEGHFLHRAVFPIWAIALVPVLLILLLMLVPWLMRPQVRTVYVEPINPKPDTTFAIFWDAPRAKQIRVLVNELPVRPDPNVVDRTYVFVGGFKKDTRVKVVASNLFGEVFKEVPIALAPAEPVAPPLLEASIDALAVEPNGAVTISWSASRAERVEFSHRGSVPLTGSFTDHPTQPQTYVISAFSSAGQEIKKTFQVQVQAGKPSAGTVHLVGTSRDRKKGKPNFEINQGRYVFFDWEAPKAAKVRLEGGGSQVTLDGVSGRARRAQLRGKGHYTFRLIATSADGQEVTSQPVEVDVTCTVIQIGTKRCKDTPEVRW